MPHQAQEATKHWKPSEVEKQAELAQRGATVSQLKLRKVASCACTKLAGIHSSKSQIRTCHQFCTLKRSIISYEWCNMMCTFVPTIGSFLSPHGSAGTFAACGYAGTNGKGRLQTSEDGRLLGPGCAN